MVKLSFEPIPRLSADKALPTVDSIIARRKTSIQSYGGFLIESATDKLAKECAGRFLEQTYGRDTSWSEFAGIDFNLHTDSGRANDMTAHITSLGEADVLILADRDQAVDEIILDGSAVDELLQTGEYDGQRPVRAFKTHVEPGNLLLFDHSQPHAFISTSDRVSKAYF